MKEMQFTAMVLTLMMAMILMTLLPAEVNKDRVANRSRWWMTCGLLLLWVQFLLQYSLGLRDKGVEQAVMLNLLFFVPSSLLLSMSMLNLQRQGRIERQDWIVGGSITISILTGLLTIALLQESHWITLSTDSLLHIEMVASLAYAIMQFYYCVRIGIQLRRMEAVLDNYYDQEQPALLRWMRISTGGLLLLALTVPAAIFGHGKPLAFYGILFMVAIAYQWFNFVRYIISTESLRMREAEKSEEGEANKEPNADNEKVIVKNKEMERWLTRKGYLKHGLTKPVAANEMKMSEYQLSTWIKASGYKSFTRWITTLRINEALRQLENHQDYNIGAIADQCGIDRSHFHRLFREYTGMTPVQYMKDRRNTKDS